MRVYTKKEDRSSMVPGVIATIFFLAFSIGIFIAFFSSKESFIDTLSALGIALLMAIVFFVLSMYFICYLIKRPRGYKAKLINKKFETYNGKQITYMEFSTLHEGEDEEGQDEDSMEADYKCYTIGDNNLITNRDYSLRIKEFNWEPKYVEEIDNSYVSKKNKVANKIPNVSLSPLFFVMGFFEAGMLFFCILGIILYPQYISTYLAFGALFSFALFMTFKGSKAEKKDNSVTQNDYDYDYYLKQELEKIIPIDNKQEKVGNFAIRHYLILLAVPAIAWFIVLMMIGLEKEIFLILYFSFCMFMVIPIILMILSNIGYAKRLIKKNKINISENINIYNIKYFSIFRASKSDDFRQYFIVDRNNNLIFKIINSTYLGNKYIICDSQNIKVGEIKTNIFGFFPEFTVNIINKEPFIVYSRMQSPSSYQVVGRNYYIKEDTNLSRYIICDNNDKEIAYISTISKNNNKFHELGNLEITLNNNVNNIIDLIAILFCII